MVKLRVCAAIGIGLLALAATARAERAGDWGLSAHQNQAMPYAEELRDPAANARRLARGPVEARPDDTGLGIQKCLKIFQCRINFIVAHIARINRGNGQFLSRNG